ncbi:AMP-binding protein [Salinarimonas ramus]|uniref:Carrier domain-containing protein n=1 Tax=Salinarimonas ramus TaxID=690164 RepID=A0A917Q6X2_9HYPH|nr:AMP-binding protein [Salinarimonas ramus]GGK32522.1 hypothetical protein GCM10011322_19040 [Salinarimonas ramus]
MIPETTDRASLARLLLDGLSRHDGPLWIQGSRTVTRPEARAMVERARASLARAGVRAGERLALHGAPAPEILAALVAALVDGVVVVPVDPQLTSHRKAQILELAPVRAVLDTVGGLDAPAALVRVDLAAGTAPAARDTAPEVEPDAPAYVFFTSGSTGAPKPVVGRRGGLAHFVAWEAQLLALEPSDRVGLLTRFSFDVVLRDVLLPLVSGAMSVIPAPGEAETAAGMMDWIAQAGVSVLHTVPSIAHAMLAASPDRPAARALRHSLFAGEPLNASLVTRWRRRFPHAQIHNLYGPTETTLAKFHARVPDPAPEGIQSCGVPLPETTYLIVGPDGARLPLGELGEVAIATRHRSLGYARPDGSLVPITTPVEGLDCYRTGDLGFRDADGHLHLRGRRDDQVKIMGVRLELAGIAASMESHPEVEKAVVIAEDDESGGKRLVAWYTAPARTDPGPAALRGFLAARLPAAGVPAHLLRCDAFPLTPNGKVDKARLVRPPAEPETYVAPSDCLEALLAAAFASVLGVERVGADADFFALGGDSLAAAGVCALLAEQDGRTLSPGAFLDAPTPSGLAALLESRTEPAAGPIPPAPDTLWFPLSPQQQRYFRTFCASGNRSWCNMVALIDLPDGVEAFAVEQAIADIAVHHDSLRLAFALDENGTVVQRIDPTSAFTLSTADLASLSSEAVDEAVAAMKRREGEEPIDVFSDRACFRATLVLLPGGARKLLWNVHHLVSDGTSQGILARSLAEWFADKTAFRRRNAALPSIRDVVHFARGRAPHELGPYFPTLLTQPVPYRHAYLPQNRPVADPQRCHAYEKSLGADTVEALRMRARDLRCTPYVLLLGGCMRSLAALTGRTDLCVVTPLAGREHPGLRDVIGDLINLVCLRVHDLDRRTPEALATQLREQVREAARRQEEQFDRVIDAIGLRFEADRNPLTGFSLNYMPQGVPGPVRHGEHADRGYKLKYDLLFLVRDFTNAVNVEIQYRTGIYDASEVAGVFDAFERHVRLICRHD